MVRRWMTYHKWLSIYWNRADANTIGYSVSTDDILDEMVEYFGEKRSVLKDVIGAWDGSAESIGEVE